MKGSFTGAPSCKPLLPAAGMISDAHNYIASLMRVRVRVNVVCTYPLVPIRDQVNLRVNELLRH
jgi:hypothetical protein